jgi:cell division protein FtsN
MIRVLAPDQLEALRSTATPAAGSASAKLSACLEFGDFDEASTGRVQARLATLALGERLQARQVEGPGWYIVYLPPLPSRAEADRVAQDLRARGIRDLAVMGETSPIRNAIALGSFREQELAQRRAADLQQRGVSGIRVSERASTSLVTRFEIREVDARLAQQLAEIQKEFPQSQLGSCEK